MKQKVIFLVGPTAIGKSAIALKLAKKINAEIISCDSMQIYKGMEIISSQPLRSFKKTIPHHLTGEFSPLKDYNVSKYRAQAMKKIREIIKKGRIPILVGGTGLYMSVLIDGIFKAKAQNPKVREKLYKIAEGRGSQFLFDRLKSVDPQAAIKIHPHDTRRIVRALEVFEVTGKLISQLQKERKGITDKYDIRIFCLNMAREKLFKRIDKRVSRMFSQGLIREVKKLLKFKLSKAAAMAIGIRELKGCFESLYDLTEAKRLIIRNTCLYAKRQLTWFRKDKRIQWLDIGEREQPSTVVNRIAKLLKR